MNLTEEYSYLGRSGRLPSQGGYGYYVLLYGKTEAEGALGHQRLSLKLRLACDTYSSFYNWQSAGYARVGDRTVLEWNISPKPDRAWEQSTLEAGGYAYPRWVDLAEGALLLETGFDGALTETLTWGYQVLDTYEGAWFPQDHFAVSGRVTVTLPALPGATVPQAAATGTLGQPLTITLTPVEDDFTHSLTWRFGQRSGTLGENLTGSLQFTPPLALAEEIPGAPSGILTLECSTWQGETLIGTAATPVTLGVPESLGPAVTAEWSDPTGAAATAGNPVQLVSSVELRTQVTTQYGAAIRSMALTLDGKPYGSEVLTESGDRLLKLTVTDSRGLTGTWQQTLTVLPYAFPEIRIDASRWSGPDESGKPDDGGSYAKVTLTGTLSGAGQVELLAKKLENSSFDPEGTRNVTGTFAETFYLSAPAEEPLQLRAVARDDFGESAANMTLSIGYATVDFLEGGRGIAFGTAAQSEGFTCHMDTDFGGHRVTGLPQPTADADAASKAYVDGKQSQSTTAQVAANTAVALNLSEGELLQFSWVAGTKTAADVKLQVNGAAPTAAWYYTPSSGYFSGGQITRTGGAHYAFFCGFLRILGGKAYLWGQDFRGGDGAGMGQSAACWNGISGVTSLTFTQPGTLSYLKL